VEFGLEDACVMQLSGGEFRENRHSESHTLLRGMNEFLSVLSTLMSDLGEIRYKRPAHNAVEHL
jgi:hypothetical protein